VFATVRELKELIRRVVAEVSEQDIKFSPVLESR
jgi:hypothetical protein